MRPTALIPILCSTAALVLAFLCMFAGHKQSFMESYDILTLNTSRIGYNLLNATRSTDIPVPDPLKNLFTNITDEFSDEINEFIGDTAERLGVDDWYSVHLLDYCEGQYEPGAMENATVKKGDIKKNVTRCSESKAMFTWDPTETIERKLNASGLNITLRDLNYPDDIRTGIQTLQTLQKATFILYCVSIALIALSLLASLPALFARGRLSACVNVMLASLAFLAIGLASALVTAVIVKGTEVINDKGRVIGLEAHKGERFMGLTWGSAAAALIALVAWCVEVCCGHRRKVRGEPKYA